MLGVGINDRPMPREKQIELARCLTLYFDRLPDDCHWFECVLIAILARVLRIGLVYVQVLLIDCKDRKPERNLAVVPDRNARESRFTGPNNGHAGRIKMHDVTK